MLADKPNTSLYTDETRKYGKSMQTYLLTDEEQNSYILGLREMVDKSGQSTLDTLKDILTDISTYCYHKERDNDMDAGYKILANIRDTMSDRASTEKRFNVLLEQYRSDVLPQVYLGWTDLNDLEKENLTHMNNFFCGLHLLVGMADVCESTVKKFERNYLDGKDIGSSVQPELKRYQKNESGTLRLMRTASKTFAVGQDEKNGVSLPWQTYLHSVGEKNKIVRFKHNRFNLAFSMALAVYHHRINISEFIDKVHGATNDLLKAVTLDIKEKLYLAGLKAFGLISKLITGPLWKLLESAGHIFEMNVKYKELVDFLQKGANDVDLITKFVTGEEFPFETIIGDDSQKRSLFEPNDELNEILYPLLQALFLSMHELLSRMVADHLPGGKFSQPTDELYQETKSVTKHNKLPEFVFGQLDQLLRYRPNATLLTNESYLMYSYNKSRAWLAGLQQEEKARLLESCMKEGKVIRGMFNVRLRVIEAKRIEIQERKKQELEEKEKKRVKVLEDITQDVCFYGLWQSAEQVEE